MGGYFRVPLPTNEPIRSYRPGSPERAGLKAKLAELSDSRTEIPMIVDGQRRAGSGAGCPADRESAAPGQP